MIGSDEGEGEWWDIVMDSGLAHLKYCLHDHIDAPFLSAFVERWQPDTNSFNFYWGDMTVTLHDVWSILGLQIDGDCIELDEKSAKQTAEQQKSEFADFLNVNPDDMLQWMGRGSIKFKDLQNIGEELEEPERRATAYLLYLICSTIFLDKTVDRAHHKYFPLLRDVSRISNYAWGAGALAYLYRRLGEATRAGCKQFCGSATLLQVQCIYA